MSDPFERLGRLADEDDLFGVEEAALGALAGATGDDARELWRWVAWARLEREAWPEALEAARNAGDPVYEAQARFHLWQLDEAERLLEEAGDAQDAEAHWTRALLAEFRGRDPMPHYRAAAGLAPQRYAVPVRLEQAEVDAVVEQALAALPGEIRAAVEGAVVSVRDLPDPHPDVDPLSLGLYVEEAEPLPPRIEVYRRNVERIAQDRAEAARELRITLLHEIGHHLGMDEDDLERLGYG